MASKVDRIVLDTNLWISFLISKDYSKLDQILFSGQCVLVFSQELLTEFIDVTNRPKFKNTFLTKTLSKSLKPLKNMLFL